jgi:AcrR family transcriptional regulator
MGRTTSGGAAPGTDAAPRRRADAERSVAAILEAATTCLSREPNVSMADVARAAGVGRVTLYAHFPSREALLDAILERTIAAAGGVLEGGEPDRGPAAEALRRLLLTSWQVLDRHRRLFEVAQRELGPARLREHHDPAMRRIEQLLTRGQAEGVFRTDLPLSWLVTTIYTLLHAAAEEVNAGRLDPAEAGPALDATLQSTLAVPPLSPSRRR